MNHHPMMESRRLVQTINSIAEDEESATSSDSADALFIEKWYSHAVTSLRSSLRNSIDSMMMCTSVRKNSLTGTISIEKLENEPSMISIEKSGNEPPFNILHPYGISWIVWEVLYFFVSASCIPNQKRDSKLPTADKLSLLNKAVNIVFAVDMAINFLTVNHDSGFLRDVSSYWCIARRCLSGYIVTNVVFFKASLTHCVCDRLNVAALAVLTVARLIRILKMLESVNGWVVKNGYMTQPVFEAYVGAVCWGIMTIALLRISETPLHQVGAKVFAAIGLALHSYIIKKSHETVLVRKRRVFHPIDSLETT